MKLKVRFEGRSEATDVSKAMMVEEFRTIVARLFGVDPGLQRLFYRGKQLEDGCDLLDYRVEAGHTVDLMKRVVLGEVSLNRKPEMKRNPVVVIPRLKINRRDDDDSESRDSGISPSLSPSQTPMLPSPSTSSAAGSSRGDDPDHQGGRNDAHLDDDLEKIREICPELAEEMGRSGGPQGEQQQQQQEEAPCSHCNGNGRRKCRECGCAICGGKDSPETQLFCEQCEYFTHMACLRPPLTAVPDGDWYCPDCYVDKDEIVGAGQKVKDSKSRARMASRIAKENGVKTTAKRDWGKGYACAGRSKVCTKVPINHCGPIPGIEVGMSWESRIQVSEEGVHRPPVSGIAGRAAEGSQSIVLAGGYEDDVDNGYEFFYTGAGGRDLTGNKRTAPQSFDQKLEGVNLALARNCNVPVDSVKGGVAKDWKKSRPVRVVRSYKLAKHSEFAPKEGYRYDGLYKLVKYWPHRGASDLLVWRYLFRRDDEAKAPWEAGAKVFRCIKRPQEDDLASKKRKLDLENDNDGETKEKRQKLASEEEEVYTVDEASKELMMADNLNSKMWEECLGFKAETKLAWLDNVEQAFTCICCSDLLFKPVTTSCLHNICKSCYQGSVKAEVLTCPCCRSPFGNVPPQENLDLQKALDCLFPGYSAGRT